MFIHGQLLVLILTLSLHGQVHTGEIIGGREVAPHGRPYMVLLNLHKNNGQQEHCGGFLLSEDFVMTAAHCQADSCDVLLGLHDCRDKKDVQIIPVAKMFPHKDYIDYDNDIMIFKLSSKANFSDNVKPIVMADKDSPCLPASCSVTGWGRNDRGKPHMSNKLMELNVTLIENDRCRKDNYYCSKGDKGPAGGDSGGPLVCEDGKAYGVVSHIKEGLYWYTKIPDRKNWIDSVLNAHS